MKRNRRSLGGNISHSRRVNDLSDQGALLYTWMIPHYDDEGRMDGHAEDIKFNVVPRRPMSIDEVQNHLLEMDRIDLIRWYMVDGKPFVEMHPEAWAEHQTFKGFKKVPSKIPKYDPKHHKKVAETLNYTPDKDQPITLKGDPDHPEGCSTSPKGVTVITPEGDPDHPEGCSTSPLPTHKRSEVKKREDSLSLSNDKDKQPPAGSSPKHFSHHVKSDYLDPLLKVCRSIEGKNNHRKDKKFKPFAFLQKHINERHHPGAILETLTALDTYWDNTENPWAFVQGIIKSKAQNYSEREYVEAYQKMVTDFDEMPDSPRAKEIKDLIVQSLKGVDQ